MLATLWTYPLHCYLCIWLGSLDLRKSPYLLPKLAEVIKGPLPEMFILWKMHVIRLLYVCFELIRSSRLRMWVLPQHLNRPGAIHRSCADYHNTVVQLTR